MTIVGQAVTKEFISKTTLSVIPACLESFLKKDAGFIRLRRTRVSMTEHLYACDFTYGLISKSQSVHYGFGVAIGILKCNFGGHYFIILMVQICKSSVNVNTI